MRVLESTKWLLIPDRKVWVCGDWHGNVGWLQKVLPALHRIDPSVTTVLHVGDWWMEREAVDFWSRRAGIKRVLVTLGNHEPYDLYSPLLEERAGEAVRISDVTWLLPRPWRMRIYGREILSLGGAASIDRQWRTEGRDWWPDERILDVHVAAAIKGPADVMVTHESPTTNPVASVAQLLSANPDGVSAEVIAEAAASRAQVTRVWNAVRPRLLFHGHMHVGGVGRGEDGRSVVSLGRDGSDGNVALLDLADLSVKLPRSKCCEAGECAQGDRPPEMSIQVGCVTRHGAPRSIPVGERVTAGEREQRAHRPFGQRDRQSTGQP